MRSTLAPSRLVRLLDASAPVEAEAGGMDFAERMSLWFDAFDAIRLQAAHQSMRSLHAAAPARTAGARPPDLASDVQRVRAVLARGIAQDPLADTAATGFVPYHRRHMELQRQMELMIGPLRAHVREALGRTSARLRQLAALDEAMEQMLAAREQALLPTAAALMERHFGQLRQAAARAGEPVDAPDARRPGAWLHGFEAHWRQALLAELELRLEPVTGLVEALGNETNLPQ